MPLLEEEKTRLPIIKGFRETSFLDWDGKITSVLYLPGCTFRCPFCHNSGLIENPDQYDNVEPETIFRFLVDKKDFIDAVCLTGGEPCLHEKNGLPELLRQIKKIGMLVKLDTNGSFPGCLKRLAEARLLDYVAMDLKAPLDERYFKASGVKKYLPEVKESAKFLLESELDYEFRTTVVPGLISLADLPVLAAGVEGAKKLVLQQFVPDNCWDPAFRQIRPYEREVLEAMVAEAKPYVKEVVLRGI